MQGRSRGLVALCWFWGAVLLALGGTGAVLQNLGPPAAELVAPVALAEPVRVSPPVTLTAPESGASRIAAAPVVEAADPGARPVEAAAAPGAGTLAGPTPATGPQAQTAPTAPEPPPLRSADAGRPGNGTEVRPIAPPDPALLEASAQGPLPRIAADGRTPIRAYARAAEPVDARPRIGIVVAGLGLSGALTDEAIRRLPPAVTLAFNPYAVRLEPLLAKARARGMEFLVSLPMEPSGFPVNDPGDHALLIGLPLVENLDRLNWALSRLSGYVGAIGALGAMRGERFAASAELLGTVQDVLRGRGLLYVDPRPGPVPNMPARAWGRGVDLVLDDPATRSEVERRLLQLERLGRERGSAVGLAGDPSPVLVDRVVAWAAGLEARGFVLVPVTALTRRPDAAGQPSAAPPLGPPARQAAATPSAPAAPR